MLTKTRLFTPGPTPLHPSVQEALARPILHHRTDEFRRVFRYYLGPGNKLMAEVALGKHRLLIWKLGDAADHLAGQYYVESDGRFIMDDMPSTERSNLRKILESYRTSK